MGMRNIIRLVNEGLRQGLTIDQNMVFGSSVNFTLGSAGVLTIGSGGSIVGDRGTATASAGAATLNKMCGTITSEALTTAAGADYTLTLTNTVIAATSLVFVSLDNGTNTTTPIYVRLVTPSAGSVAIVVRNAHGASALNGTIKVNFLVIK